MCVSVQAAGVNLSTPSTGSRDSGGSSDDSPRAFAPPTFPPASAVLTPIAEAPHEASTPSSALKPLTAFTAQAADRAMIQMVSQRVPCPPLCLRQWLCVCVCVPLGP